MNRIDGKIAVITGGTQGLGAAIVRLDCGAQSLLYAGTLGRADDPLLRQRARLRAIASVFTGSSMDKQRP